MRGHDRNLIEQAIESGKRRGKSDGDLVGRNHLGADSAAAGAECVSSRGVQRGIHQPLHGEGNILGGKRAAVGKSNAVAELEGDLLAVFRNLPRFRQFGLEFLRMAIDAHQHAARQVADRQGRIVIDQERIESLRLGAQAEAQFTAVLRERRADGKQDRQERKKQQSQICSSRDECLAAVHAVTSSFDKSI